MLTQHFLPNHSGTSHIDTWTLRVIDYPQSEVNAVSLEPVSLSETNIKIGRHEDCDLFLPDHDSYISRQHCHLKLDGESVILWVDGGNGVYIDDNELKIAQGEYCTLYGGEVIGIGEYKIELCRAANTVSPLPPEDILNNGEDNSSSFEEIFGITGENFVENKKPEGGGGESVIFNPPIINDDWPPTTPPVYSSAKAQLLSLLEINDKGLSDEEFIQRIGVLLKESMTLMMTLKNLRTEIKEEVGGVTKHAPQFNYLKVAPDVTAALNILLSDQIPHFLGYAESIKEISSTLIKYHASLLKSPEQISNLILQQLDPSKIEAAIEKEGGVAVKIQMQKNAKCWVEYKKKHTDCRSNIDLLIKEVLRE